MKSLSCVSDMVRQTLRTTGEADLHLPARFALRAAAISLRCLFDFAGIPVPPDDIKSLRQVGQRRHNQRRTTAQNP